VKDPSVVAERSKEKSMACLGRETMKAIVQDSYGSPDVLQFRDVDMPVVGDDEVLVRVYAAGSIRAYGTSWRACPT
jgi:hypothetical protein